MREIRTYSLRRGRWSDRLRTADWGLLDPLGCRAGRGDRRRPLRYDLQRTADANAAPNPLPDLKLTRNWLILLEGFTPAICAELPPEFGVSHLKDPRPRGGETGDKLPGSCS
jgi:hypothetical protein